MNHQRGFTSIEILAAIFLLGVSTVAITGLATLGTRFSFEGERQTVATGIVTERVEYVRSLAYEDVGYTDAQEGEPDGELLREEDIQKNQQTYNVTIDIELVDDPINGTLLEGSLDEDSADYKKVTVKGGWTTASFNDRDVTVVTYVSSLGALGSVTEGSLCTPGTADACPDYAAVGEGACAPHTNVCPESGVCPGSDPSQKPFCPPGAQFCAQCYSDSDCGAGEECNVVSGGFCEAVPGACTSSDDCTAVGEVCIAGSCTSACTSDLDCSSGEICNVGTGACTATCDGNSCSCEDGLSCNTQSGLCSLECTQDTDCYGSQVCNPATNFCEYSCAADSDCGAGQVCNVEISMCEDPPTLCATNADCSSEEICDVTVNECKYPGEVECTVSSDCGGDGFVCEPDLGLCQVGQECSSDDECSASGEVCDSDAGLCRTTCNASAGSSACNANPCNYVGPLRICRDNSCESINTAGSGGSGGGTATACVPDPSPSPSPSPSPAPSFPPCGNSGDCSSGNSCVSGQCQSSSCPAPEELYECPGDPSGSSCSTNDDCSDGEACGSGGTCGIALQPPACLCPMVGVYGSTMIEADSFVSSGQCPVGSVDMCTLDNTYYPCEYEPGECDGGGDGGGGGTTVECGSPSVTNISLQALPVNEDNNCAVGPGYDFVSDTSPSIGGNSACCYVYKFDAGANVERARSGFDIATLFSSSDVQHIAEGTGEGLECSTVSGTSAQMTYVETGTFELSVMGGDMVTLQYDTVDDLFHHEAGADADGAYDRFYVPGEDGICSGSSIPPATTPTPTPTPTVTPTTSPVPDVPGPGGCETDIQCQNLIGQPSPTEEIKCQFPNTSDGPYGNGCGYPPCGAGEHQKCVNRWGVGVECVSPGTTNGPYADGCDAPPGPPGPPAGT